LTKILVIGGYTGRTISNVEVIDLSGESLICPNIPDYPDEIDFLTATFYDGKVIACGGYDGTSTINECYTLGPDLIRWNQVTPLLGGPRIRMGSSIVDHKWLISGGENSRSILKSTLIFDGSQFIEGPEMQFPKTKHCQVTINATHVFFANGGSATFVLDWETQEYAIFDNIPTSKEYGSCGVINNVAHGMEVLVADETSSYIFSFTDLEWRDGPKLPLSTVDSFSVPLDGGFLSMGGKQAGSYFATIYKFDENQYNWLVEAVQLETPRQYAAAVAVPDSFLNCK